MSSSIDIAAVYHEFTEALTEVLAENAVGVARRGRFARAHAPAGMCVEGLLLRKSGKAWMAAQLLNNGIARWR